uniref:CTCK domain-containing protein n=1 Tax=Biomphalaria glabrata TaxID=6526 RepID=A0A2C9M6C0_BIOGL
MSIVMLVFFGVIFFQLTTGTQVIGGGYNTESDVEAETALRLVRLAFASSSKRSGRNVLDEKLDLNPAPEIQKVKSSLSSSRKRTRRDPTHRNRNDAFNCHLLSMMLGELSPFLNLTQFVGLASQSESYPSLPDNQPSVDDCPSGYGSWWPRSEMNLRSTCPWVYEEIDLGPTMYPRKIQQAVCICETCIAADSMNCEEIRQNMTVFSIRGCPDGVAIYNKLDLSIVVGCHCANAAISQVRITEA